MNYLITGGTGTAGSTFVKKLMGQGDVTSVRVYSRDEYKQEMLRRELSQKEGYGKVRFLLGDVRDKERLKLALRGVDRVIHAAALKQVGAGEYNPTEFVATNIGGTQKLAMACIEVGVDRAILLSTDKAVEPANHYGNTKRVAESTFINCNAMGGADGTKFSVCRYGNVLGSRGSVLELWKAQDVAGVKFTITDPDATRFWLTPDRAVSFVLGRIQDMEGGEIFVPKTISSTVSLLLQAKYVTFGKDVEYIGLRLGEKQHETLLSEDECLYTRDYGTYLRCRPGKFVEESNLTAYRSDTNPSEALEPNQLRRILDVL